MYTYIDNRWSSWLFFSDMESNSNSFLIYLLMILRFFDNEMPVRPEWNFLDPYST